MRQVRGDQEQVNWTEKSPQVNAKKFQPSNRSQGKRSSQKQPECNYCGATPSHPKDKCRAVLLKYVCRKCGKEGHIARKCLSRSQHVSALDGPVSDCEEETHQLFTLDVHSVRTVSVQKGKKYFGKIKLSSTNSCFNLFGKRSN